MIKSHKLVPIPDYCELIDIKTFYYSAAAGAHGIENGIGYAATTEGMDETVRLDGEPSDRPPSWATHVAWFNK